MAPAVRTNRGCLLCVLLCLFYGVESLFFEDKMEAIRRGLKESIKVKEHEKKNDAIMSKLMNAVASLVNKDQLKTIKNELQQTGKEADRQQVEKLDRIEAAVKDFDENMKKLNSPQRKANREKAESEATRKITKMVEDFAEKFRRILSKMGVSGGEAENYQNMLQEVLKAAPDLVTGSFSSIMKASKRMKALLFVLALTSAATTLIDDDDLKELKENIQTLKQETKRKRVSNMLDSAFLPDLVEELVDLIDILSKLLKTMAPSPQLEDLLQDTKFLGKYCKIWTEQHTKNEDAKIRDDEEKIKQMEKLIMSLEEWRS
ncbi:hypothetical protein OJAV_G00183240 [Oryzias javanicus]|uniref:Uncharacterized protein n=1 Tax=Oryzias javanicus TaxID=123683 RepID=A0A437CED2_ORYJA|nr:hypothetical protein OJAV_G00183240 [Oryzias javanicus]